MFCGQCGANNVPGTHFCSNCGAGMAPTPQGVPQNTVEPPAQGQSPTQGYGAQVPGGYEPQPGGYGSTRSSTSLSIDFRRLGTGDWVSLGATILLFVSLFLSWYSATGLNDLDEVITLKENIFGQFAGGFRVLILITCIFIILYLLIRTMTPRGLHLPLPHWQVLTIFTALQAILTVLAFFLKPGAGSGVPVSWQYGAYIGLPAAVIALIGSVMRSREPEVIVGAARPRFGNTSGYGSPPYGQQSTYAPAGSPQQVAPVQCAQCGAAVPVGTPYCNNCGTPTGR
jgi:hypothetical protein